MDFDDVVYLTLLFCSIIFGYFYRTIENVPQKKLIGTVVGLLVIFAVSGLHIIHPLFTFLVNALIILHIDKRKCHLYSFAFSFLYLFFFRTTVFFGIPYPPAHTNLIQMMLTLKLVGLAFEVNASVEKTEDHEEKALFVAPNLADMFHYSFNYIGVLTGPYYRYRTFVDYFEKPYCKYADWKHATLDKIRFVPLFGAFFLIASHFWPVSYATTPEFYSERSWLYRYWFIFPNFFTFRMRIYIGILLSECVCTMAGLGAYPTVTKPTPGRGPSDNFNVLHECNNEEVQLYDFETIHNINPYGSEFALTYRESIKHWNICIQYWLAVNVYKRFPSKKYRVLVTMLVSAFWHGVYLGHYVCLTTVPLVLPIEDVYYKLYLKEHKDKLSPVVRIVLYFAKMHFFAYQAIAFLLLDVGKIFQYYNSIYHAGFIVGLVLYVVGLQLLKAKRTQEKAASKEN